MAAPVLQNHTMRRGALTRSGAGGVPLAQFMVTSGAGITSWAITLASGTPGHWNLPTDGSCPTPNSTGDSADLSGGPYVFNVTATNADGTSAAKQLTINVAANVVTVASPAEIDNSTTGIRQAAFKAALGGKVVEIARGSTAAFANRVEGRFRTFNTHTGTFDITSEDPSNPSVVSWLFLNGGCSRIRIYSLWVLYGIPTVWVDAATSGSSAARRALQTGALLQMAWTSTNGICSDIEVYGNKIGTPRNVGGTAPAAEFADPTQWITGVKVLGSSSDLALKLLNINIHDNELIGVKDGNFFNDVQSYRFKKNLIDHYCSNGNFGGGMQLIDVDVDENDVLRPFYNRADPDDHPDGVQIGASTARADYIGVRIRNNNLLTLDGDRTFQGPFNNDVGYNGTAYFVANGVRLTLGNGSQYLTGFKFIDCESSGNLYDNGFTIGTQLDLGDGWEVRRVTAIRGKMQDVILRGSDTMRDPGFIAVTVVEYTGGAQHYPNGIVEDCIFHSIQNSPGITYARNSALGPTGLSETVRNETARLAFFSGKGFQDPGNDDPRIGYRPVQGGPFMNPDGTYRGALFPDGSRNDGTVYLLTPPTAYSSACDATVAQGSPLLVTFQLNSAAVSDVTITPARSGATGSFSPSTVVIAAGTTTGTTNFTPTSTGALQITSTDNAGLTDPPALDVTVTAAIAPPTSYTQVADGSSVALGGSVSVSYTLNRPATQAVTLTPAVSGVSGVFSPATVVVGVDASAASVDFAPSSAGAAVLSVSDDRGLTDPADILVSVIEPTGAAGSLRRLFRRAF